MRACLPGSSCLIPPPYSSAGLSTLKPSLAFYAIPFELWEEFTCKVSLSILLIVLSLGKKRKERKKETDRQDQPNYEHPQAQKGFYSLPQKERLGPASPHLKPGLKAKPALGPRVTRRNVHPGNPLPLCGCPTSPPAIPGLYPRLWTPGPDSLQCWEVTA